MITAADLSNLCDQYTGFYSRVIGPAIVTVLTDDELTTWRLSSWNSSDTARTLERTDIQAALAAALLTR